MIWQHEATLAGTSAIPRLLPPGFVVVHLKGDIGVAVWAMDVRSEGDGSSISEERVEVDRIHCKGGDVLICDSK